MIGIAIAMITKPTPDNLTLLKGDLLVMVGVLGAAVFTVFSGKYMEKYGNLPVMVFSAVSGVSVTFILSLSFGEPFNGSLSFDGLVSDVFQVNKATDAYKVAFEKAECLKMVLDWRNAA